MVKQLSRIIAAAGTAAALSLAAAPAQALSVPSNEGSGVFQVSVHTVEGAVHSATVSCPGGHGHPHGEAVCAQLSGVRGSISKLAPADSVCTLDYRPVTVRAQGVWEGGFHSYEGRFGNYCTAVGATGGHLFDVA